MGWSLIGMAEEGPIFAAAGLNLEVVGLVRTFLGEVTPGQSPMCFFYQYRLLHAFAGPASRETEIPDLPCDQSLYGLKP
jgi:hypothetical protein